MFGGPGGAGGGVDGDALDVAVAVGPYFGGGVFLVDEGVVLGGGAVVVDADDFSGVAGEVLCVFAGEGAFDLDWGVAAVADAHEEGAVGEPGEDGSEVLGSGFVFVNFEDFCYVVEAGAVVGGAGEDGAVGFGVALGEGEVEGFVFFVFGVEDDVEEAALAAGEDFGDAGDGFGG